MSASLTDKIAVLIEPTIEELGFELVRVKLLSCPRGGAATLQIMAENGDGLLTVENCAKISRAISVILDVEDPIKKEYSLEVSSPGLDRPLTRLKDFVNYAGYETKIEMSVSIDNRHRYKGILKGTEADMVLLEVDGEIHKLDFSGIQKAKLVMNDQLIASGAGRSSQH
jgi:ribosome maturation factor RimP